MAMAKTPNQDPSIFENVLSSQLGKKSVKEAMKSEMNIAEMPATSVQPMKEAVVGCTSLLSDTYPFWMRIPAMIMSAANNATTIANSTLAPHH